MSADFEIILPVRDYDLDATFACGQAFGWERSELGWAGVVRGRSVELSQGRGAIIARAAEKQNEWNWLHQFLQTDVNLSEIVATFPQDDEHLHAAVKACHGLRLLRQEPWECLASFILSSTKQIVQIRQIVRVLCERYGERVIARDDRSPVFAFPKPEKIAVLKEADLRACKMGFRAPYLLSAARQVASGDIALAAVGHKSLPEARDELMRFDGVGEKIADCVLLFAYGFPTAFPVDVWVRRVLVQFYFRGRRVQPDRLRRFILKHFGPNAGYAQQYLFHHVRLLNGK